MFTHLQVALTWVRANAGVIQTVAQVAGLIGLFFALRQLQEMRKQTREAAFGLITTRAVSMTQILIDYPRLYPYFYNSRALTRNVGSKERAQVLSTAEGFLDVFDHLLTRGKVFSQNWKEEEEQWVKWIKDMLRTSVVLRRMCAERTPDEENAWYDMRLKELLTQVESELSTVRPSKESLNVRMP